MDGAGDSAGIARTAVLDAARTGAYDRYAAALLAPRAARDGLLALAAFEAELARIAPATRREPRMGEIRLQWWREALEETAPPSGHPIADAVNAAARVHAWPRDTLGDIIDAHAHDGLADAFSDDQELLATLELGEATLFRLGGRACGMEAGERLDALASRAGIAYGLARRLAALPQLVSQGHVPIPKSRLDAAGISMQDLLSGDATGLTGVLVDLADLARDRLADARRDLAALPRKFRSPFLPLALVEPYLDASVQPGRDPLRATTELSHFARLLRLARGQVFGRM